MKITRTCSCPLFIERNFSSPCNRMNSMHCINTKAQIYLKTCELVDWMIASLKGLVMLTWLMVRYVHCWGQKDQKGTFLASSAGSSFPLSCKRFHLYKSEVVNLLVSSGFSSEGGGSTASMIHHLLGRHMNCSCFLEHGSNGATS